jgi:photosystem I subunit 8
MTAAYLPSILVPLIGLVFPGLTMAFAFIYIEQDSVN